MFQKLGDMGVKAAPCQHGRGIAAPALKRMRRRQTRGQSMPVKPQPIPCRSGAKGLGQPVFMIKSQFHETWYKPDMVKSG